MKKISKRKSTHFSNIVMSMIVGAIALISCLLIFFVNLLQVMGAYNSLLSSTIRSEQLNYELNERLNNYLFGNEKDEYIYADKRNVIRNSSNIELIGRDIEEICPGIYEKSSEIVTMRDVENRACLVKTSNFDKGMIVAYVPFASVAWKALRGVLVPMILLVFIEIALSLYVSFARLHRIGQIKKEGFKLFGKLFWDKRLSSHVFVISVFSMIMLAISVFYIQLIISYCDQNIQAKSDLDLIQEYSICEEDVSDEYVDPFAQLDFGASVLIRTSTAGSRTMDVLKPGTQSFITINNSIPEDVLADGFSGIRRINDSLCYANTRVISDYVYISAIPISELGIGISLTICMILLMSLFMVLIILTLATTYRAGHEDEVYLDKSIVISEEMMDDKLRKVIKRFAIVEGISLLAILLADSFWSNPSLISFLLSNYWKKGFNLFSVTMILIIVVSAYIITFIFIKLISILGRNMGPRGVTISKLLCSLIKFIVFLVVLIISLLQMGINVGALLAGAGIASAAVSFCAQSTVSDLLSGFFIVFEGSFKIGDWIMVDDWRGQVIEIGMRTTKINYAGTTKVVNNSKMTNVQILDASNSGAVCYVDVAYKEDLREVIKLIENNAKIIASKTQKIQTGPFVLGVTGLEDSSCRIKVWATCEADYAGMVERGLRLAIKELFDDNNIEIPFPQVSVHMEE